MDDTDDPRLNALADEFLPALADYTEAQGAAAFDVRHRNGGAMGQFPFPDQDNPALAYLFRYALIIAKTDVQQAILWLGAHAWMEGAVDAVSRQEAHPPRR